MAVKENKVVRGFSLSKENIEWIVERALGLSTPGARVSDSQFLDNLISRAREEQERAKRILKQVEGKKVTQ